MYVLLVIKGKRKAEKEENNSGNAVELGMSDFFSLPDAVATMIMWMLPVNSIIQCRCVCKSWFSLISSSDFIKGHLLNAQREKPHLLMNQTPLSDISDRCSLLFHKKEYTRRMSFNLLNPSLWPSSYLVGSANGLLCFSLFHNDPHFSPHPSMTKLLICNPYIGRFHSVPHPRNDRIPRFNPLPTYFHIQGFGFDERTMDHTFIVLSPYQNGYVYSLKSNMWSRMPRCPFTWVYNDQPVHFLGGKFHWISQFPAAPSIKFYDLESETFGEIPMPPASPVVEFPLFQEFQLLHSMESSLTMYETTLGDTIIWKMEKHGSVESWTSYKVPHYTQGSILGFRNKDDLLIMNPSGSIYVHTLKNNKFENAKKLTDAFQDQWIDRIVHGYVPSLVLLDKENNYPFTQPTLTTNVDLERPTPRKRTKRISES